MDEMQRRNWCKDVRLIFPHANVEIFSRRHAERCFRPCELMDVTCDKVHVGHVGLVGRYRPFMFTVIYAYRFNLLHQLSRYGRYSDRLRARPGSCSRQVHESFLCSTATRPTLRSTQTPIQWVQGFFPSRWGGGAWSCHSPPHSAKFKNGGAIPPLPIRLHAVVLN
jgi:hypothetical protein